MGEMKDWWQRRCTGQRGKKCLTCHHCGHLSLTTCESYFHAWRLHPIRVVMFTG